ncbi:MAG: hypothetical protein PHE61_00040 [Candidatus Omnitrophica bacterium]|nr:hypothetical protein [Candidatus Omnitrophota bacterium]
MVKSKVSRSFKTAGDNTLLVRPHGSQAAYFALEGEYEFNRSGELCYRLRDKKKDIINLSGAFRLDTNHDLVLTLDGRSDGAAGDEIKISGEWIVSSPNEFVFSYNLVRTDGGFIVRTLSFKGAWDVDRANRLLFKIKTHYGLSSGTLSLEAAWKLGKDNRIVYRYKKRLYGAKALSSHEIVFDGRWAISEGLRLSYLLGADSDTSLNFEAKLAGHVILADKGVIKYSIGIRVAGSTSDIVRNVAIYGRWVINGKYELTFEYEWHSGGCDKVTFRGTYHFARDGDLIFSLRKDIPGLSTTAVCFRYRFLGNNAKLFLQGDLDTSKKWSLLTGVTIPW